jgi:hypothetical protein
MDRKVERAKIKFCVKLDKSVTQTLNILRQAYDDEAMSHTLCFEWHRLFKGGRMSLEDDKQSRRPSTSIAPENAERIRELVHVNHQRTINDTADTIGVPYGSVQTILTSELNMFVPQLLTPEQKEHHVTECQNLRERAADNPPFTSRIIISNKP